MGAKSCGFGGATSQKVRAPGWDAQPTPRRQLTLESTLSHDEEGSAFAGGWFVLCTTKVPTALEGVVLDKNLRVGLNSGLGITTWDVVGLEDELWSLEDATWGFCAQTENPFRWVLKTPSVPCFLGCWTLM